MAESQEKYILTPLGQGILLSILWISIFAATFFILINPKIQKGTPTIDTGVLLTDMPTDSIMFSVLFDPKDSIITKQGFESLKNTAEFAKQSSNHIIYIEGFAADTANAENDITLARARASATAVYLEYLGISADKIVTTAQISTDGISSGNSNRVYIYLRKQ